MFFLFLAPLSGMGQEEKKKEEKDKGIDSRFMYVGLTLAGLYGLNHAEPNTNNPSSQISLTDVEAFSPTGSGLFLGFELFSKLPLSFFAGVNYNYLKDASDSAARRGVTTNAVTLTRFKQKLRVHELLAEGGLNINLRYEKSILQFFASLGVGNLSRFERIAYSSTDATIKDFLRESRSDSLMTRLSGGLRYINDQRLFFEGRVSVTTLSIESQDNLYISNDGSTSTVTRDNQELADIDDEKEYLSLYIGGGYYF